jgi:hypothetical protein
MVRLLLPAPLSEALSAVQTRIQALATIADAVQSSAARVCIVDFENWAATSRDALEATVASAVGRWERGEIPAEEATRELLRTLSSGGYETTQPG